MVVQEEKVRQQRRLQVQKLNHPLNPLRNQPRRGNRQRNLLVNNIYKIFMFLYINKPK
jgi:hypothetical protein